MWTLALSAVQIADYRPARSEHTATGQHYCDTLACRREPAEGVKLAHAVKPVASITIGTRIAQTGEVTHPELFGELRLHEALRKKPIAIPDTDIGRLKVWREIGELVRKANHPLDLADFANHIGTKDMSRAANHVRRAEAANLMQKIGHKRRWVMVESVAMDSEGRIAWRAFKSLALERGCESRSDYYGGREVGS